jgi:thiol-disulfide isomerase/thioredoxin
MVKVYLFYASWCGACQHFEPVWKKLEKEMNDKKIQNEKIESEKIQEMIFNPNKNTTGINLEEINAFPTVIIVDKNSEKKYEGPKEAELRKELKLKPVGQTGGCKINCLCSNPKSGGKKQTKKKTKKTTRKPIKKSSKNTKNKKTVKRNCKSKK